MVIDFIGLLDRKESLLKSGDPRMQSEKWRTICFSRERTCLPAGKEISENTENNRNNGVFE